MIIFADKGTCRSSMRPARLHREEYAEIKIYWLWAHANGE